MGAAEDVPCRRTTGCNTFQPTLIQGPLKLFYNITFAVIQVSMVKLQPSCVAYWGMLAGGAAAEWPVGGCSQRSYTHWAVTFMFWC